MWRLVNPAVPCNRHVTGSIQRLLSATIPPHSVIASALASDTNHRRRFAPRGVPSPTLGYAHLLPEERWCVVFPTQNDAVVIDGTIVLVVQVIPVWGARIIDRRYRAAAQHDEHNPEVAPPRASSAKPTAAG